MTSTITNTVPLPAGATRDDDWQGLRDSLPYRLVFAERGITGHRAQVVTAARQWANGDLDTEPEQADDAPQVSVFDADGLNAEQTREVTAVLLAATDELCRWTH